MFFPRLFLAALLSALLAACHRAAQEDGDLPPLRVTVLHAAPAEWTATLRLPGTLVAREEVPVSTALQGQRILSVAVEAGDRVQAGQVLARLESVNVQAQVQQVEAQIARARAQLQAQEAAAKEAAATLQRYRKLAGAEAVSRQTLDQQQVAVQSARAQVQAAKAEIAQLQAQLKDSRNQRGKAAVVAPVAGVVARRNAEAGALAGAEPLFFLIKDDAVELAAEVGAADLALLHPGQAAQVHLYGTGETRNGTVRRLDPAVDAATRLGKVRIAFPTGATLVSGGYGEAAIRLPTVAAALTLPESALTYDHDGKAAVWLVDDDGRVSRRAVEIGRRRQGRVEILHGITAAEHVIRRAGAFVNEGDVVTPAMEGV